MIRHLNQIRPSLFLKMLGQDNNESQKSAWENVFLGKCLSGQMSFWANVVWANVLLGKRRMGKWLWANVVWSNVIEPFQPC
jgi:hypothetical protein